MTPGRDRVSLPVEDDGPGAALVHLKVVPGASREGIAGRYGHRLRVKVAVPAQAGRANRAVLALLARRLGLPERDLALVRGASSPRKSVRVTGLGAAAVERALLGD
ncbi:MAG: DUF167 domain-containing protein [Planctomycetota bacterium]